jgi:hypothetical protein
MDYLVRSGQVVEGPWRLRFEVVANAAPRDSDFMARITNERAVMAYARQCGEVPCYLTSLPE